MPARLEVIAIALDDADEPSVNIVRAIIEKAAARGIHILLIAEALSPILLHQLLRAGAEDFVPYPLPENALHEAIERLHKTDQAQVDYASAIGRARWQTWLCSCGAGTLRRRWCHEFRHQSGVGTGSAFQIG